MGSFIDTGFVTAFRDHRRKVAGAEAMIDWTPIDEAVARIIMSMQSDLEIRHAVPMAGYARRALLAALKDAGYVVVPVEPTEEMLQRGKTAAASPSWQQQKNGYQSMLAAAPEVSE